VTILLYRAGGGDLATIGQGSGGGWLSQPVFGNNVDGFDLHSIHRSRLINQSNQSSTSLTAVVISDLKMKYVLCVRACIYTCRACVSYSPDPLVTPFFKSEPPPCALMIQTNANCVTVPGGLSQPSNLVVTNVFLTRPLGRLHRDLGICSYM
jgi:hypothetical protein